MALVQLLDEPEIGAEFLPHADGVVLANIETAALGGAANGEGGKVQLTAVFQAVLEDLNTQRSI